MINSTKLLLFLIGMIFISGLQAQGLQFYGNKEFIERRTSYLPFNEEHIPTFTKYIQVDFELQIREDEGFGYLFHLIDTKTGIDYSLTCSINRKTSTFKFNTEGQVNHISMDFSNDSIQLRWLPVRLSIDLSTGESSLKIGEKVAQSHSNIKPYKQIRSILCFGLREHLVDVPSFAIRKLNIEDEQQSFSFLLNESTGEEVHDINGKVRGRVVNPYWLINDSYYWKKAVTIQSSHSIGSKFNVTKQEIQFVSKDSLYTYQVDKKELIKRAYVNELPVRMVLGTNFMDEINNKIYVYEINNLPVRSTTVAALDIATLTWQPIGKAFTRVQLHQHNGYWDEKNNRYIVFGGFGNTQYSNKFRTYNQENDKWEMLDFDGDHIDPRFFSSLADSKDRRHLYIYGGVGNASGDQSVGHNYYNDLYSVDIDNAFIKKCWSHSSKEKLVPAGQMVLSEDEKYLYVLRYPEYVKSSFLQLYQISVENGDMKLLGDSIPFISGSILSNVALYYNSKLNEFYSVVQEFDERTADTRAIVYTLSAPPVGREEINYYLVKHNSNWFLSAIILFIVLLGCAFCFIFYKKKKKKTTLPDTIANEDVTDTSERKLENKVEFNEIFVYGIFTVYNKSGRDITYLFSNKLKHMFLYILLKSTEEGVSSTSLNNIFWPDKTEEKAKNLKGVTVSNLRKVLSDIEGVELVYEKGFFKILVYEPCYCDYLYLNAHLAENPHAYEPLFPIWERGKLLEDVKQELFDKFKQRSEDVIFSSLPPNIKLYYRKKEFKEVLRIAAILLKRDPLHELALVYSMHAYNQLNDYENLSKIYAKFIREYRGMMGEDYTHSLDTLLSQNL